MTTSPLDSPIQLPYLPVLLESPSVSLPKESLSISLSKKLGCFAGRSVSYMRSKQGKRRAIQTYILSELVITAFAVLTMILAGIYLPAILLSLMLAYLLYATLDLFK